MRATTGALVTTVATALVTALLLLVAPSSVGIAAATPLPAKDGGGYYLALGDSLAAGYLHGTGDHRTDGYVGPVLSALQARAPQTQLVNLACSGETTTTLLKGGICSYEAGSQLAQAVTFLRDHAGSTRLVTLDIGGNDVAFCGAILLPAVCTDPALATLRTNLGTVLETLRAAAGPTVQIVVLNYYDPFLVYWLRLGADQPIFRDAALTSVRLLAGAGGVNEAIATASAAVSADVADVQGAFSTTAFAPTLPFPEHGDVPLNVIRICQWTTMCSALDFHTNPQGYAVLAGAVVARLRR
ncbi:MAG: hypothetical protein JWP82_3373 [Humibacillus sp.]|nr:hypothetical protein [Humibacillus sp.]